MLGSENADKSRTRSFIFECARTERFGPVFDRDGPAYWERNRRVAGHRVVPLKTNCVQNALHHQTALSSTRSSSIEPGSMELPLPSIPDSKILTFL